MSALLQSKVRFSRMSRILPDLAFVARPGTRVTDRPSNGQDAMESLWRGIVTTRALTRVEQVILEILESYPGEEVLGRELRGLLRSRGFRRTAPAFVFTMMRLADKGLVTCHEEVRVIDGVEIRERYYSSKEDDDGEPSAMGHGGI